MKFKTTVLLGGKTATGLPVPDDVVESLGAGRRPKVHVTVGGHSYQSTIASMGGQFLIPLAAEHREAAGLAPGDDVEVHIEPDDAPREVVVPADLAEALEAESEAQRFFGTLSFTHRKEWVRWVEEAKKPETRQARIAKTLTGLAAGKRTH